MVLSFYFAYDKIKTAILCEAKRQINQSKDINPMDIISQLLHIVLLFAYNRTIRNLNFPT